MKRDKVYTNEKGLSIIKKFINNNLHINEFNEIVDPCAGSGEFSTVIPVTHQFDIEPDSKNIIKMDFFDLDLDVDSNENRLIVCSPPFGVNFDLGSIFLHKASKQCNTLLSIVPSYIDVENLLDGFVLIAKKYFIGECFIKDGKAVELKHIICIWRKRIDFVDNKIKKYNFESELNIAKKKLFWLIDGIGKHGIDTSL